jgi:hypothetical protein
LLLGKIKIVGNKAGNTGVIIPEIVIFTLADFFGRIEALPEWAFFAFLCL